MEAPNAAERRARMRARYLRAAVLAVRPPRVPARLKVDLLTGCSIWSLSKGTEQ